MPTWEKLISESNTATLTNKTLTSPKIETILDSNGNEVLGLTVTADAENYIELKNNITGSAPII